MDLKEHNIVSVAKAEFYKAGIQRVSMEAIAQLSGISKKTLYRMFNRKDFLVETVLRLELDALSLELTRIHHQSKNAIEELKVFLTDVNRMYVRMEPIVFFDLKRFHAELYNKFKMSLKELCIAFLYRNLEFGQQQKIYSPFLEEDYPRYFMEQLLLLFEQSTSYGQQQEQLVFLENLYINYIYWINRT